MLKTTPIYICGWMWMQLDDASAYLNRLVKNDLDRQEPNKWIGRGGPQKWSAKSLHLTSLDYFS